MATNYSDFNADDWARLIEAEARRMQSLIEQAVGGGGSQPPASSPPVVFVESGSPPPAAADQPNYLVWLVAGFLLWKLSGARL
jgi:hypothetical protein